MYSPASRTVSTSETLHALESEDEHARRSPAPSHRLWLGGELLVLLAVLGLAFVVRHHPGPLPGDVGLERAEQTVLLPHHALSNALEAASTVAWPVPSAITLAVVVVLALLLRRWLDAIVVVICSLVADGATYPLSQLVHRPRPAGYGIHRLAVIHGTYSYPSGHVVHAVAVFGLILFLSFQVWRDLPDVLLWLVRAALLLFIVAMPFSRILEGEHWPSDALGGVLFGAFWLVLSAHLFLWARHRFPRLLAPDER